MAPVWEQLLPGIRVTPPAVSPSTRWVSNSSRVWSREQRVALCRAGREAAGTESFHDLCAEQCWRGCLGAGLHGLTLLFVSQDVC